jgi:hypothetical protein
MNLAAVLEAFALAKKVYESVRPLAPLWGEVKGVVAKYNVVVDTAELDAIVEDADRRQKVREGEAQGR